MTVKPTTRNLEAAQRAHEGSVLTHGDSEQAGNADRFSVSGTATWVRGNLGWYPITASSMKQSTIAFSSHEAELVAALAGACEGMRLRQQWNWLLKFGRGNEETELAQGLNSKDETHQAESVLPATVQRMTRSTTCEGGNE